MAIGSGCYHQDLLQAISGQVIGAGEMKVVNGKVEVFGESFSLGLKSKPEDALFLQDFFK